MENLKPRYCYDVSICGKEKKANNMCAPCYGKMWRDAHPDYMTEYYRDNIQTDYYTVYMLLDDNKIMYVGCTRMLLSSRLADHKYDKLNPNLTIEPIITGIPIENTQLASDIETMYCKKYNPVYNKTDDGQRGRPKSTQEIDK